VERPIFYAIAVIIAGYLPIYVLTGPSGRLFQPMADTMSFALLGSLLCALTLLPVLCAYFLRKHVHEPAVRSTNGCAACTADAWAGACGIAWSRGAGPLRLRPARCC
jgi:cobalt-zinc-cadmium resistance protein CzcA